jgi:hypothetical protein
LRRARAGMEGFRGFQELRAPAATDLQRLMKLESIPAMDFNRRFSLIFLLANQA